MPVIPDGILGDGVEVGYSLSSPMSWTKLEGILECVIPKSVADKIDKTIHGSSGYRRHMGGLKDLSNCEITILQDLTNTVQRALFALQKNRTTVWWRVEVPANPAKTLFVPFEFQGYVEEWGPAAPVDDKQTLMVSVGFDGDDYTMYAAMASVLS